MTTLGYVKYPQRGRASAFYSEFFALLSISAVSERCGVSIVVISIVSIFHNKLINLVINLM